jgi:glycosyltransferase involved in cell wall biosynthesis
MDGVTPSVSIVIPAHNERPTINRVVHASVDAIPGAEVIVVDDGSTDNTHKAAARAGARVIRLDPNQGKGAALRRGIQAASGEILVFIDGDGQDSPSEIPLLIGAFEPDVDLVLGSRFLGNFRPGAITRLNLAGTQFITFLVNHMYGCRVSDPLAGFRAVRRSIFERIELKAQGYDIEVDLLLRVLRAGGRVVEVPASRSPRPFGTSDLSSFRDGIRIARRIFQVRFEGMPGGQSPREMDSDIPIATRNDT